MTGRIKIYADVALRLVCRQDRPGRDGAGAGGGKVVYGDAGVRVTLPLHAEARMLRERWVP